MSGGRGGEIVKEEATKNYKAIMSIDHGIYVQFHTPVDTKVMWRAEGLGAEQLNRRDTSLLHAVRRGDTEVKALLRLDHRLSCDHERRQHDERSD